VKVEVEKRFEFPSFPVLDQRSWLGNEREPDGRKDTGQPVADPVGMDAVP
jgi:hypothetical protein